MDYKIAPQESVKPNDWTVVVNLSDTSARISDGMVLAPNQSKLLRDVTVTGTGLIGFPLIDRIDDSIKDLIRKEWTHAADLFPEAGFRTDKDFYRSEYSQFERKNLVFWYAEAGYKCGIHNEHDFFETHVQLLGQGEMQKFHTKSYESIYEKESLVPGRQHSPFYCPDGTYPWHQYEAITDCIWMAIEQDTPFDL